MSELKRNGFRRFMSRVGEKNVKALEAMQYTIVNDDFEATVEVRRNDIEDDNLAIYGPQSLMSGESDRGLPDDIVFELVNNGFTNLCFDGQAFFECRQHDLLRT